MSRSRKLITAVLASVLTAAAAAPAHADTQQFAGILEDGRLVTFTSQSPFALATPIRLRGLQPNERILAMARNPEGAVYGLGSSAQIYLVDVAGGRVAPAMPGRTIEQGLRGTRFSIVVSAGSEQVRILSDVGQDLIVELTPGGGERPGPGFRRADGQTFTPAVGRLSDGRLTGVDLARGVLVRETAPASGEVTTLPFTFDARRPVTVTEPTAFTVGVDGRAWFAGTLADLRLTRQSQLVGVDLGSGGGLPVNTPFSRRVDTIAALGLVAEDRAAPRLRIRAPRRISLRRLLATKSVPSLRVRSDEAAQGVLSLRVRRRPVGFNTAGRDTPGVMPRITLFFNDADRARLRRSVGERIQLVISANDYKGNGRTVIRQARLVR